MSAQALLQKVETFSDEAKARPKQVSETSTPVTMISTAPLVTTKPATQNYGGGFYNNTNQNKGFSSGGVSNHQNNLNANSQNNNNHNNNYNNSGGGYNNNGGGNNNNGGFKRPPYKGAEGGAKAKKVKGEKSNNKDTASE